MSFTTFLNSESQDVKAGKYLTSDWLGQQYPLELSADKNGLYLCCPIQVLLATRGCWVLKMSLMNRIFYFISVNLSLYSHVWVTGYYTGQYSSRPIPPTSFSLQWRETQEWFIHIIDASYTITPLLPNSSYLSLNCFPFHWNVFLSPLSFLMVSSFSAMANKFHKMIVLPTLR